MNKYWFLIRFFSARSLGVLRGIDRKYAKRAFGRQSCRVPSLYAAVCPTRIGKKTLRFLHVKRDIFKHRSSFCYYIHFSRRADRVFFGVTYTTRYIAPIIVLVRQRPLNFPATSFSERPCSYHVNRPCFVLGATQTRRVSIVRPFLRIGSTASSARVYSKNPGCCLLLPSGYGPAVRPLATDFQNSRFQESNLT